MSLLTIEGVTHWSIPVNDLEESEKFYGDLLGLTHKGRLGSGGMSCFNVGDHNILLCQREEPRETAEARVHHSFTVSAETLERACKVFRDAERECRRTHLPGTRLLHREGVVLLRPEREPARAARPYLARGDAGAFDGRDHRGVMNAAAPSALA